MQKMCMCVSNDLKFEQESAGGCLALPMLQPNVMYLNV